MTARWPPNSRHRLTVRATGLQLLRWGQEADRGKLTTAQLVAQGADFYCMFMRALREFAIPEEERGWQ